MVSRILLELGQLVWHCMWLTLDSILSRCWALWPNAPNHSITHLTWPKPTDKQGLTNQAEHYKRSEVTFQELRPKPKPLLSMLHTLSVFMQKKHWVIPFIILFSSGMWLLIKVLQIIESSVQLTLKKVNTPYIN